MTTTQLRRQHHIPANSFVHILGNPTLAGYRKASAFEFEPQYSVDGNTWTESELLLEGKAVFRVQIDRFTVQDFTVAAQ